jgi:hypothetical protein
MKRNEIAIWMRASVVLVAGAAAAMMAGCSPQPSAMAATISDRVYSVTPDAMKVKAGIVVGEVTELKVTERVEEGSGRVASPAKLSGKLVLNNVSADQTVRLVGGTLVYIDSQGKAIALEDNRLAPSLKLSATYGSSDRLDPGQNSAHVLDVDFPVEALKAKKLKEIRLDLSYIPSPYKAETLKFVVSIGGQSDELKK